MFDRYSEEARLSLYEARSMVARDGGPVIEPEHVLLGVLRVAPHVVHRIGLNAQTVTRLVQHLREELSQGLRTQTDFVLLPFSPRLKVALKQAINEAEAFGHDDVAPEHLLLACLVQGETNPAAHLVIDAGLSIARIRNHLADRRP
jgi:ATP-dependent Clp protease ATP-binding subunit ClpC